MSNRENNPTTKTPQTRTANDARLQEAMSTSRQSAFLTTIDNHDVPIRISVARSSSPPSSVARHPRRRPSGPDSTIHVGNTHIPAELHHTNLRYHGQRISVSATHLDMAHHTRVRSRWEDKHNMACFTEEALWDLLQACKSRNTKKINRQHLSSRTPAHASSALGRPCYKQEFGTAGLHPLHKERWSKNMESRSARWLSRCSKAGAMAQGRQLIAAAISLDM